MILINICKKRSDTLLKTFNDTIQAVIDLTWPILVICSVVLISVRLSYIIKNKEKFVFYKELLMFTFIIYILCLFQIVTFQDDVSWSTNNFIPFREILRYNMGSRLFIKNVIGNMFLFLPYGLFTSLYLKNEKPYLTLFLTLLTSCAIETVQLIIGRVFDIDDIILNVLGGFLGYLIYYVIKRIWNKLPEALKSELFLNVLAVIILMFIITLI